MEFRDLAFGQGDDANAGEQRLLVKGGDMLEVAREPVEALGQDDVDAAGPHRLEQRLVAGPEYRGA
nr:hypothetical protein [Roseomonas rubea]